MYLQVRDRIDTIASRLLRITSCTVISLSLSLSPHFVHNTLFQQNDAFKEFMLVVLEIIANKNGRQEVERN